MFMAFGYFVSNSPEGQARTASRNAIKMCRDDLQKQTPGSGEASIIRGACEKMEADFTREYGYTP